MVDERSNELRNVKQKNEQLEQMIRNGKDFSGRDNWHGVKERFYARPFMHFSPLEDEHNNDEKKLLSLLQESQEERDELLTEQVSNTRW